MKNKRIGKYVVYSLIGFIIISVGTILAKLTRDSHGIMQTLSYIFIGIGAGVFGQNFGTTFNIIAMKKIRNLQNKKKLMKMMREI